MSLRQLEPPGHIEAVLFDFHSTLVDQGDAHEWLELAWRHAGRPGSAREGLGPERCDAVAAWADRIWEHVFEVDPRCERDLSQARHREVWSLLTARNPAVDGDLADALYAVMLETWAPYDDTRPTLLALRARGIRIGVVSNIGLDIRAVIERGQLAGLFDAVTLSYEVGAVKPDARIFGHALRALGVRAAHALMVGDNAVDDGGAARIGIRTLLLPRTRGRTHGLDAVLRLV